VSGHLTGIRAAWGAALLIAPDAALCRASRQLDPRAPRALVRVLGARQVIQSAIAARRPTRRVLLAGVAVDTAHLATMLALAALRPDLRQPALISSTTATIFIILGVQQAHRA